MNSLLASLRPPVFDDQEKTRVAALLNSVVLASLAATVLFVMANLVFLADFNERIYLAFVPVPVLILLKLLLQQGHTQTVAVALVLTIWGVAAVANFTAGGVRAPNFAVFIIPTLLAGLTLGRRASILIAAVTVGLGGFLLSGEGQHWLPPLRIFTPASTLVLQTAVVLVVVVLLNIAISSIRRTEQARRASEEQYRLLFESNPYPIFIIDSDTLQYLEVNDAVVDLLGYSREEFRHMSAFDLRPPEDHHEISERQERFRDQKAYFSRIGLSRYRKKDGSIIEAEISAHNITYKGRRAAIVAAYDMTARIAAEEALRRSQEMFETIFQTVPVGIGISSLEDGRTIEANDALTELTGYPRDEMVGQPASRSWVNPAEREEMVRALQQHGSVKNMEVQWRRKNGEVRDVLISVEMIELLDGNLYTLGMGIDITGHKQAERERIDLEARRAALELKERFISQVSHEVRTPLAVIMAAKEALQHYYDRLEPERRQEHFDKIDREVRFMSDMIEEVLTVSRARAGKLRFEPVLIDMVAVCRKLFEQMHAADYDRHRFVFDSTMQFAEMYADERLLRHILINLLSNAAKYSPEGSEIRMVLSQAGQDIVIQVYDQGIGIPDQDQAMLFEPFHRARNAADIKGTGLGLTIVKESVLAYSGTVNCESNEGKGTTFTIRLPMRATPVC